MIYPKKISEKAWNVAIPNWFPQSPGQVILDYL
jgi:hypothetical protein